VLEAVGKKLKQCAQESGQHQVSILTPEDPGPSGIGVVISGSADGTIRIARWIGQQDNNVAECVALLEALQCALGLKAKALRAQ
jgi:Reverse transcriptase-like